MFTLPVVLRLRRLSGRQQIYLGSGLLVFFLLGMSIWMRSDAQPATETSTYSDSPNKPPNESRSTPLTVVKPTPITPTIPAPLNLPEPEKQPFVFGIGTELDQALNHRITKEAPVKLLTSWYNGSKDLGFMNGWRTTIVPKAYNSGYALHLIIYSNDAEQNLTTKYGAACGRQYPLSEQFLLDIQQLAKNFAGGKLYVSMFTEFQTYPCADNTWANGENYYRALKDQYLAAMNIFHEFAPGSQVSLSWGGWQAEWDDVAKGGGRSLFKQFADVMNTSDFQSFQAMGTTGNLATITDMTKALHPYQGGVMVAHYKPDNGSQSTYDSDMKSIFTPQSMATLQQNGLFAFSFMDIINMNSSETSYQMTKNIIQNYAR